MWSIGQKDEVSATQLLTIGMVDVRTNKADGYTVANNAAHDRSDWLQRTRTGGSRERVTLLVVFFLNTTRE